MANVTIRNLDDAVVETLKARARDHHRSLEAELRMLLTEAAQRPTTDELRRTAARIAAMTPEGPQSDSTEIVREFRER